MIAIGAPARRLARPARGVLVAVAAWPVLWFLGQVAWAADELLLSNFLPWFNWPIIMQLCASALPLLALVAWPHHGRARTPRPPSRSTSSCWSS